MTGASRTSDVTTGVREYAIARNIHTLSHTQLHAYTRRRRFGEREGGDQPELSTGSSGGSTGDCASGRGKRDRKMGTVPVYCSRTTCWSVRASRGCLLLASCTGFYLLYFHCWAGYTATCFLFCSSKDWRRETGRQRSYMYARVDTRPVRLRPRVGRGSRCRRRHVRLCRGGAIGAGSVVREGGAHSPEKMIH